MGFELTAAGRRQPPVPVEFEELDGRPLARGAQVWPMSNALPMGWSWSFFFFCEGSAQLAAVWTAEPVR